MNFRSASLLVEQEEWEESSERSDAFHLAVRVVDHEEWAADPARSSLFKQAAATVAIESWSNDDEGRSPLFKFAQSATEYESWEESSERSGLFKTSRARVASRERRRAQKKQQEDIIPRCAALLLAVAHMARALGLGDDEKSELKDAIAMDRTQSTPVYVALSAYEKHGNHSRFMRNLWEVADYKLRMKDQQIDMMSSAAEHESWEESTERSELFKACASSDEEEVDVGRPDIHINIPAKGQPAVSGVKGGDFGEYSPQGVADFDSWIHTPRELTREGKDRAMSFLEL